MVVKGTKRNRPKPQAVPERPSPTKYIAKIACLKKQALKEDALDLLHELAKLVAPIMSKHDFHVGLFCEMYPKSQNLLGLNVNGGLKILIRLRQHHNALQFISKSELIGTVLHELTHNKFGPHNQNFYSFLDKITREFEDMMSINSFSLYGEVNFDNMFGNNSMLNRHITNSEEDGKGGFRLGSGKSFREVNKLGGTSVQPNKSMRELILLLTERRLNDGKRCHETLSEKKEQDYIKSMEDDGELPLNDDLDIVIVVEEEDEEEDQSPASKKTKRIEVINLSDEEDIVELD